MLMKLLTASTPQSCSDALSPPHHFSEASRKVYRLPQQRNKRRTLKELKISEVQRKERHQP